MADTSSSRNAYLSGGISSTQSAYLEGVINLKTSQVVVEVISQPSTINLKTSQVIVETISINAIRGTQSAYLFGQGEAVDSQSAYLTAPLPASSSQSAYIVTDTKVRTQQVGVYAEAERLISTVRQVGAYVESTTAISVIRQVGAYVEIQEPFLANSSKHAYLSGNANALDSQPAYTEGDPLRSSQYAYLKGQVLVADSQPAYIVTNTKVQVAQAIAYAEREIKLLQIGQAFAYAEREIKLLHVAQALAYAEIQTPWSASDSQHAFLYGNANVDNGQPAYLEGAPLRSSQHAYLKGQVLAESSQPAYIVTDTKVQVFQDGAYVETSRKAIIVSQDGAYVETSRKALAVTQDGAYVEVQDPFPISDFQTAYLYGQVDTSDNQHSYAEGFVPELAGNQSAYTIGQSTTLGNSPAYTHGLDTASDNKSAYLIGQSTASDAQTGYSSGLDNSFDSQHAFTRGSSNAADSQSSYLVGQNTDSSQQPAYTHGQSTTTNSQLAYLIGSTDTSDNQHAYLDGINYVFNSQHAYLYGIWERLHPDGDISQSDNWQREDTSTSNLYQSIDEYPYNDSDYVWYDNTSVGKYFEVSLENPSLPTVGSGEVKIVWRARRRAGSETVTIKMELRQGAAVIASQSKALSDTDTTYIYTLTGGEKASITDWTDLRLRFTVESLT